MGIPFPHSLGYPSQGRVAGVKRAVYESQQNGFRLVMPYITAGFHPGCVTFITREMNSFKKWEVSEITKRRIGENGKTGKRQI